MTSKINPSSFCLFIYFALLIFSKYSESNICLNCLCKKTENTLSIDCHNKKFTTINILRFGLISPEYNGTLSTLNLSGSNITYLPAYMFENLRNLKILNLSNNSLQEIHGSVIKNLKNLSILNLSNNFIKAMEIPTLPLLHTLDLSKNSLNDVDFDFHVAFPNLIYLNLSNNYLGDSIISIINLVNQVKYLDLSYNNICLADNENFTFLKQLISLNISRNAIESVTNQQFPVNLIELDVSFNLLTEFSMNLSKLRVLNIQFNKIKNLDNLYDFNELKYLNISGNMLENLPDITFPKLKVLDLSYNKLTVLPVFLSQENYPSLDTLLLSGNLFKSIYFASILNINFLIMQNMSFVKTIDENSFKNIKRHKKKCMNVTLSHNGQLTFVHEKVFKGMNLCFLDLSNNQFTFLNSNLLNYGLKAMYGVNLQGNPFHCNCSLQWMVDDIVPWLYSIRPDLLNNLRCSTPENLQGKRMVHWYNWKEEVLCNIHQNYSPRIISEALQIQNNNKEITLGLSTEMFIVIAVTMVMLIVLIAIGMALSSKESLRRKRINRAF